MHLIEDMTFDWEFAETALPYDVERECKHVIQDKILPNIEQILDDWDKQNPGMRCVIPKLEIDISCEEYAPEMIKHLVVKKFETELKQQTKAKLNSTQSLNSNEVIFESINHDVYTFFFHYLETGIVEDFRQIKAIEKILTSPESFPEQHILGLYKLLSTQHFAIKRLLNFIRDEDVLVRLLSKKIEFYKDKTFLTLFFQAILTHWVAKAETEFPVKFWQELVAESSTLQRASAKLFRVLKPILQFKTTSIEAEIFLKENVIRSYAEFQLYRQIKDLETIEKHVKSNHKKPLNEIETKTKDTSEKPKLKNKIEDENRTSDKSILSQENKHIGKNIRDNTSVDIKSIKSTKYKKAKLSEEFLDKGVLDNNTSKKPFIMSNAGLLLLHPFLIEFFKEANLISDKKIIQPYKAAQLLHFLATGKDPAKDVDLYMAKVILGLDLKEFIAIDNPLSSEEQQLCDNLLNAVLRHWKVLEKSGIETLRAMFLVRQAHVRFTEKTILINVEHLAQDVLLKKLPWGLGLVRLPWLKRFIEINCKS